MGRFTGGQNSEWCLARQTEVRTHKLSRVACSVLGTETLPGHIEKQSCVSEVRQLNGGSLHQPPGRHSIPKTTQVGEGTVALVRGSVPVGTSNTCAGGTEQGCRSPVQGEPLIRGLDPPPTSNNTGVAEVRAGNRRSLRLERKRTMPSLFLPSRRKCTTGCGCTSSPVAKRQAVRISTSQHDIPHSSQSQGTAPVTNLDSPVLAIQTLGSRDSTDVGEPPVAPPHTERLSLSGERRDLPPTPREVGSMGLARERWNLDAVGLPPAVIETIQGARASSTQNLYSCKWRVFEAWCSQKEIISFQCSVVQLLNFLQDLLDKGKAFSTIKVYLAAISACHVGFGDKTAGQHPLVCRFMRGARRKRPISRPLVPLWDLALVLSALSAHPFEPLEHVSLKFLSIKTALLVALTTAKRVSELQAFSVKPSCLQFGTDFKKVRLRPNPGFVPKVMDSAYRCQTVELEAFHPPPFISEESQVLNCLCPVRALRIYIQRTAEFRRHDQLFVAWATHHRGLPLSRQRLSHWILEAISAAYQSKGSLPPEGMRAHSTRGMATSWALFRGVSIGELCNAANWASGNTFARFYRLDVSGPSLAHAVLGVGSSAVV
ncbi:uncharacterized protein LOC134444913 [Engraulis encrasicolus]|uniref:uncharacterized protein LOC134444913 n=1 Tax=Engraulis encrasicolus TaxID=184585 RepID=UPI002FD73D6F